VSLLIASIAQALHLAFVLAAAPLALGVSRVVAARLARAAPPSLWQPWRDLIRLARKDGLVSEQATGLFAGAPLLAFAATVLAAALVPSFALGMAGAPCADLIVVVGLLLFARVAMALAALESGTALGGLAASRSMTLAGFTEPALLFAIFPLALLAGTTNLDAMEAALREGAAGPRLPLLLALAALGVAGVARPRGTIRPTLPLTEASMTGEALALEYSGRVMALVAWGRALRRLVWVDLLANLAIPAGLVDATGNPAWWAVGLVVWAVKVAAVTAALAAWEAARPARAPRLVELLGLALLLGLLATALLFAGQGLA